jgi:Kazal-type serine protease inhibitor domain
MSNKSIFAAVAASAVAFVALQGCAVDTQVDAEGAEQVTADSADELVSQSANAGYYVVTQRDTRRCVSPLCGGVFVKSVNQATTKCADNVRRAECYVSGIKLAALGLTEDQEVSFSNRFTARQAVVRATMRFTMFNNERIGTLRVSEAWNAASDSIPEGAFLRIAERGIRCFTAPCPNQIAYTLNTADTFNLTSYNLSQLGTPAQRNQAQTLALTERGVLIAGSVATPKCLPTSLNCGPFVSANNFFLPVTKLAAGPRFCGGLLGVGCNANEFCSYKPGDLCGAADAPGTCMVKPDACALLVDPVCGCDDKTYSHNCLAANAGVGVSSKGACASQTLGKLCGSRGGVNCGESEYCAFPIGNDCGRTDRGAACVARPTSCTREVVTVCGCDGKTYSNKCNAAAAGNAVSSVGACRN